ADELADRDDFRDVDVGVEVVELLVAGLVRAGRDVHRHEVQVRRAVLADGPLYRGDPVPQEAAPALVVLPGGRALRVGGTALRRPIVAGDVAPGRGFVLHLIHDQPARTEVATDVGLVQLVAGGAHEAGVVVDYLAHVDVGVEVIEVGQILLGRVRSRVHAHPVHVGRVGHVLSPNAC